MGFFVRLSYGRWTITQLRQDLERERNATKICTTPTMTDTRARIEHELTAQSLLQRCLPFRYHHNLFRLQVLVEVAANGFEYVGAASKRRSSIVSVVRAWQHK